jgi:GTP-binding protein EngB required for normal cell division
MSDKYILFSGRPNSGKSTTIKALTGLKVITGKFPGTTRKIEMYPISHGLTIVDMPGYGRNIRASRKWEDLVKDKILSFMDFYAKDIIVAVHVINISTFLEVDKRMSKKGLINLDVEMINYLKETLGQYPLIAANKIDKGKENDILQNLQALISALNNYDPKLSEYVFPVSAKKGEGIGRLKNHIMKKLISEGFGRPFEFIH